MARNTSTSWRNKGSGNKGSSGGGSRKQLTTAYTKKVEQEKKKTTTVLTAAQKKALKAEVDKAKKQLKNPTIYKKTYGIDKKDIKTTPKKPVYKTPLSNGKTNSQKSFSEKTALATERARKVSRGNYNNTGSRNGNKVGARGKVRKEMQDKYMPAKGGVNMTAGNLGKAAVEESTWIGALSRLGSDGRYGNTLGNMAYTNTGKEKDRYGLLDKTADLSTVLGLGMLGKAAKGAKLAKVAKLANAGDDFLDTYKLGKGASSVAAINKARLAGKGAGGLGLLEDAKKSANLVQAGDNVKDITKVAKASGTAKGITKAGKGANGVAKSGKAADTAMAIKNVNKANKATNGMDTALGLKKGSKVSQVANQLTNITPVSRVAKMGTSINTLPQMDDFLKMQKASMVTKGINGVGNAVKPLNVADEILQGLPTMKNAKKVGDAANTVDNVADASRIGNTADNVADGVKGTGGSGKGKLGKDMADTPEKPNGLSGNNHIPMLGKKALIGLGAGTLGIGGILGANALGWIGDGTDDRDPNDENKKRNKNTDPNGNGSYSPVGGGFPDIGGSINKDGFRKQIDDAINGNPDGGGDPYVDEDGDGMNGELEGYLNQFMDSYAPYLNAEYAKIDAQMTADISLMREQLAARGIFNSDLAISMEQAIRNEAANTKKSLAAEVMQSAMQSAMEMYNQNQQMMWEREQQNTANKQWQTETNMDWKKWEDQMAFNKWQYS